MSIQEYNRSSSFALGDFSNIWNVFEQDNSKPLFAADDQKKLNTLPSNLGDFTDVWKFLNHNRDIPTLDTSTKENHNIDDNDNDSDNDNIMLPTHNNNVRLLFRLRVRDPSLLKASQPQSEIVIEVSEQKKTQTLAPLAKKSVRFRDETGSSLSDIKEYYPYAKIDLPRALTLLPPDNTPIHVFIDNSNIIHGFGTFLRENRPNLIKYTKPKLNYSALLNILHRNRAPVRKVLVASEPLIQSLQTPEKDGYEVSVLKRVPVSSSSSDSESDRPRKFSAEQGVDELIQLKILESLLDYQHPQVLVLATGDGKAAQFANGGFYATAIRALERGWRVEIVSWATGLSGMYLGNKLRKVAKKGGGAVEVRILDEYWDKLIQT